MKRACKKVNIEDRSLIKRAVLACFAPPKKRRRYDTRQLFASLLGIEKDDADVSLCLRDEVYDKGVSLLVDMLVERIQKRDLQLKPVKQEQRRDNSSGKVRTISILSIEQLLFDHIAVVAMADVTKRIGEYQVSSIPKRRSWLWKESHRRVAS